MKRHGGLFPQIIHPKTLQHAHYRARRGKSYYREVKWVNANEDLLITKLHFDLAKKRFTTSPYEKEEKFDGRKNRLLYKLPYYPDRIVQHALISVCENFWIPSYIRDTYQSIPGRGTGDARKRVWKHIKGQHGLYALKFDISKYYPSVDNEILKARVRHQIKCPDTLWLLDDIIDSEAGIPIGNYTSQHFGNLYLSPFDWWVKQTLRIKGYFRYCDDIVVLANSASECHALRQQMFAKLRDDFNLSVKDDWQVFPVDKRGLDFVGYVFYPDHVRLRPKLARSFRRKTKEVRRTWRRMSQPQIVNGVMSYWGWAKHANAKRLWTKHVDSTIESAFAACDLTTNPLKRIMT